MPHPFKDIRKIAIFLPRTNPFYLSTWFAMKQGFAEQRIEVCGWTELLDEAQLIHFCQEFKPDAVLEMNRSRVSVPNLPADIVHIGWIVDLGHHDIVDFSSSQILYFFNKRWLGLYTRPHLGIVDWLPPGYCPIRYRKKNNTKKSFDFSFAGHIPLPWANKDLARVITSNATSTITFGDIVDLCTEKWRAAQTATIARDTLSTIRELDPTVQAAIEKCMEKDPAINYDINCRMGRTYNRRRLIDLTLQVSRSLKIVGSESWRQWPDYKRYYGGFLSNTEDLAALYQHSRLNLHEGVGLHMRLLDCMGAGGCVLYLKQQGFDFAGNSMNDHFEAGRHYILADADDFTDIARQYLKDNTGRARIASAAARLAQAEHTWSVRAKKILGDITRIMRES